MVVQSDRSQDLLLRLRRALDDAWVKAAGGAEIEDYLPSVREALEAAHRLSSFTDIVESIEFENEVTRAVDALESDARDVFGEDVLDPLATVSRLPLLRLRANVWHFVSRLHAGLPPRDELPFLLSEITTLRNALLRGREPNGNGTNVPTDGTAMHGAALEAIREAQIAVSLTRAGRATMKSQAIRSVSPETLTWAFLVHRSLDAAWRRLHRHKLTDVQSESALDEQLSMLDAEKARLGELLYFVIGATTTAEERALVDDVSDRLCSEIDAARVEATERPGSEDLEALERLERDGREYLCAIDDADRNAAYAVESSEDPGLAATPPTRSGRARVSSKTVRRRLVRNVERIADLRSDCITLGRIDRLFGRTVSTHWETFVFWLIMAFLGLMVVEHYRDADPPGVIGWTVWAETAICGVLLLDFTTRFVLTPRRWRYFKRHFFTEFLPSWPFGLLANLQHVAAFEVLSAVVFVRLIGVLRTVRPFMRLIRLFLFAVRATDRLIERNTWLLNKNIVFFADPGHEEGTSPLQKRVRDIHSWIWRAGGRAFADLTLESRIRFATDRVALIREEQALIADVNEWDRITRNESADVVDLDADDVIRSLRDLDEASVADSVGPNFAVEVTESLRLIRLPVIRRLPVVRFILGTSRQPDPLGLTARLGNVLGDLLEIVQRLVHWFADLDGAITGAQFLDRVGLQLVKATAQPAKRLITFSVIAGIAFLLVKLLRFDFLSAAAGFMFKFLSMPVLVLGVLCFAPLVLGIWFRRIAGQSTDFFDRISEAQFLSLTEMTKESYSDGFLRILSDRVVVPEAQLDHAVSDDERRSIHERIIAEAKRRLELGSSIEARHGGETPIAWQKCDFILLYFRDFIDGAFFHRNDTKVVNLLLGNIAIENIRRDRLRYSKAQRAELERLDVARGRGGLRGPYMWFNCITQSISQRTGRLIVEYNENCIPLAELPNASTEDRHRYESWLERRRRLTEARQRQLDAREVEADPRRLGGTDHPSYRTTGFNALNFLTDDSHRDRAVASRYGAHVLELVREDRVQLVRDVFGTFPVHELPRERRMINPYETYQRYVANGRIFALPFVSLYLTFRALKILTSRIVVIVRDVINPRRSPSIPSRGRAGFEVARRKIHRMRRPAVMELLRMRAAFDVEYLGLPLLGRAVTLGEEHGVVADLRFLDASEREWEELRLLRADRERAQRQLGRLLQSGEVADRLRGLILSDAAMSRQMHESLRAVVSAWCCNHEDIRTVLETRDRLRELLKETLRVEVGGRRRRRIVSFQYRRLERAVHRTWHTFTKETRTPDLVRAMAERLDVSEKDLRRSALLYAGRVPLDVEPEVWAIRKLLAVAEAPAIWTEQLLAVRTVQSLALIDIFGYEDLVRRLGEFDRDETLPPSRIRLSREPSTDVAVAH